MESVAPKGGTVKPESKIVRADLSQLEEARQLLSEYYEALQVVQRDSPRMLEALLGDPEGGFWIAYAGGVPAGCVAMRQLPVAERVGECKRLYVRSQFRGFGIADELMDHLEEFARDRGLRCVYLDSKEDLHAAIALYARRGYEACERFNDNLQATIFLRKDLAIRH